MPTISMFYGILISLYFYALSAIASRISMQNTKGRMRLFPFLTEHC